MITFLITYWIATTIYGAVWLVKNSPLERQVDTDYFTVLEVIAKIFPAMLLGWIAVPALLLHQIKFKRK